MLENQTLLERLQRLEQLTPSERKIAGFFEANYPLTAFETIISLSEKVGVGKSTLGRFIIRLGYSGFADFIRRMQEEMLSRLETPIERYGRQRDHVSDRGEDQLDIHIARAVDDLRETGRRIKASQFRQAAEMMARGKGRLFVTGASTSQALADYFRLLASYIRPNVQLVEVNVGTMSHQLADITSEDVLFALTHQRFAKVTINICRWFAKKKAPIILLTDRQATPISDIAAVQLVSHAQAPLMFASRCSSFLILEALIAAMTVILDNEVNERFDAFDEIFSEFSPFHEHNSVRNTAFKKEE